VDIQRVGAQELDVNVVPADVFEQDKTDPKNPVLRLRDWLLDILSLRVASAALTNATVSQATIGSADITTLTTPTVVKVTNLNADLLDDHHASNSSGDIPVSNGTVNTGLNSDQLDGYHAGNGSGNISINNGTLNISLNADQLDGYHAGSVVGQIPVNNGTVNKNLVAEWAVKQTTLTVSVSTILDSNACIIEVATTDAVTLTIPAGLSIGHQYRIKRTVSSANGISVARSGSETIEGLTSFTVQGSKVSATLDTGEVAIEKVSSTAWAFVGGQVSGSNSNSIWVKFSDGTMEQWGFVGDAAGQGIYFAWTWVGPYRVFAVGYTDNGQPQSVSLGGMPSNGDQSGRTSSNCSVDSCTGSNDKRAFDWMAIGRWK
jgi:hypothetical protein